MVGRSESQLMRGGSLSPGSRIAVAICVGVLSGRVFSFFFLFPDGLFSWSNSTPGASVGIRSLQISLSQCESLERMNVLKTQLASLAEKNGQLKKQGRELTMKIQLAEQGKD